MGALVSSLPGLLQAIALLATFFALGGPGPAGQRRAAWTITSLIVLLLTIVLPWLHLIAFMVFLVIITLVWRKVRWPLEIFAVAAVLSGSLLDVSKVWLPPEVVRLADGRRITGYVLSVDGEWTSVLRESNRAIILVRSDNVAARTVCNVARVPATRTIGQIILGERGGGRNPPCPVEET